MRKSSFPVLITVLALMCGAFDAGAAQVGGMLSAPSGQIAHRELHFENHATRDIFMAPTSDRGEFSADLPPGIYSLRGERGTIFVPEIIVEADPVNLGTVNQPTGFNPWRIFQMEGVVKVLVHTPAPSTAYLTSEAEGIGSMMPAVPMPGPVSQPGGVASPPPSVPAASPAPASTSSRLMPVPN